MSKKEKQAFLRAKQEADEEFATLQQLIVQLDEESEDEKRRKKRTRAAPKPTVAAPEPTPLKLRFPEMAPSLLADLRAATDRASSILKTRSTLFSSSSDSESEEKQPPKKTKKKFFGAKSSAKKSPKRPKKASDRSNKYSV